jgi:serine-type D-Ala-D-Ala carboxypeptidase
MCLVEDGLLSLNRPVQEYVPEFRGAGKDAIMVHHLLTHTSGLRDEDLDAHAASKPDHPISSPAANQSPATYAHLELRSDAPLAKPPGQEVLYLNYGFVLLGDIVRRISGQSLGSFADDRIFRPLGMGDTSFGVPEAQRARLVRRPATSPTAFLESPERLDGTSPPGPGGAFGTARDLAVFGQMFLQRGSYGPARVLSPASVAQMTHNQTPGLAWRFDDEYVPEASRGLGWNVRGSKRMRYGPSLLSDQTFQHYGAGGVWLWVDPVHEVVVVYLSLILAPFPGVDAPGNADLFANAVIAAIDT